MPSRPASQCSATPSRSNDSYGRSGNRDGRLPPCVGVDCPPAQSLPTGRWPDHGRDPIKAILHYAQALEAPHIIRDSVARLAEQARDDNWSHEEYLAAVLPREVTAREAFGAMTRIRSAGLPTRKSLKDFN